MLGKEVTPRKKKKKVKKYPESIEGLGPVTRIMVSALRETRAWLITRTDGFVWLFKKQSKITKRKKAWSEVHCACSTERISLLLDSSPAHDCLETARRRPPMTARHHANQTRKLTLNYRSFPFSFSSSSPHWSPPATNPHHYTQFHLSHVQLLRVSFSWTSYVWFHFHFHL